MFWTGLPGELHELVAVLTDEPFLVVAGDVVPHLAVTAGVKLSKLKVGTHRSVPVEVVENGDTGLVMLSLHPELSVVRLRLSVPPRLAPVPGHLALTAAQSHVGTSPEPTWDREWSRQFLPGS